MNDVRNTETHFIPLVFLAVVSSNGGGLIKPRHGFHAWFVNVLAVIVLTYLFDLMFFFLLRSFGVFDI